MKMAWGVVRPEMTMDLGSKEVEQMIDEGAVHGQPTYCFVTIKKFGLMVGLKFVHVFCCMLLLKLDSMILLK